MFERPTGAGHHAQRPAPPAVPLHRGWLFRPGDPPAARRITLVGFVFGLLALYGLWQKERFFPSERTLDFAWPLGLAVGLCAIVAIALDRNTRAPVVRAGPVRRPLGILFLGAMFAGIGWLAFAYGAPSLWTRATGAGEALQAQVLAVHPERRGRGCPYRIDVHVRDLDEVLEPCVDKALWASVTTGDALVVEAFSGPAGWRFGGIRKAGGR